MTKLQAPCVVCKTPIYVKDTGRETALCAACKRQGKASKRKIRHCTKCEVEITPGNASQRPSICLVCYAKVIEAELERAKAELEEEKLRVVVVINDRCDDMTFPDTAAFGGHEWGSAIANPVE